MPEGSRGTVLAWAVAAVLVTLAALRLLGGGEGEGAAAPPVRVVGGGAAPAGPAGGGGGVGGTQIYVHVAGAVRRPGLLRVPARARAAVAIERAGGFSRRADVSAVNLAAELKDGQQVVVPVSAGAAAGGPGGAAGGGAPGAKPSLATATLEQLDGIDGIGPTLAERIIEHRDEAGGLATIEGLQEVEGVGEARFEALREALQP